MLSVKNLKKEYDKFKIDKVSFSVERGKITGLIGNNGAGKTTVLKCVIGVLQYDFGEIIIDGLMLDVYKRQLHDLYAGRLCRWRLPHQGGAPAYNCRGRRGSCGTGSLQVYRRDG